MIAPRLTIRAADLFCGAGGSSTGALAACHDLGYQLDLTAINHWPVAVETHTANHGGATHFCEDLGAIDPLKAVPGGHLHLLVASPECTHHSNARGGRPMQDQSRASAWHITRWAAALRIDNILIENVPEFRHWGPLGENGRPLKSKRGATFRAFLAAIRSLGYRVEHRILNAADYGDATTRKRLFVIARRGSRRIHWPEPTHAPREETDLLGSRQRWRAAREIIDWTIPGKSIFARKKPLSANTMRRIIAGLKRFGGPELEPFIVMLNGTTAEHTERSNRSAGEPLPTVTTANHLYLAEPFVLAPEGIHRGNAPRGTDQPLPTITATRGGGHVVEAFVVGAGGAQYAGHPATVEKPLGTVLTKDSRALVQPFLVKTDQTGAEGPGVRSTEEPAPTITNNGAVAVCEPFIIPQFASQEARDIERPVGTITTQSRGVGLCQPFIVPHFGEREGQEPRTHSVDEPTPAVTGQGAGSLVEPFIVEFRGNHAGKTDGDERVKSLDGPLPTQTCDNRFGLAEPFVLPVTHGGDPERVYSADDPLRTITGAHRGEMALVQSVVVQTDQTGSNGGCIRSADDPLGTVISKQNVALVQPHLTKFYGTGTNAASVEEPLDTVTAKDRFGLVQPTIRTADGQTFALDIHFRMLQPHELAGAMSFPAGYVFTGNREAQVKQIGNAVPVNLSKALIRALLESEVRA